MPLTMRVRHGCHRRFARLVAVEARTSARCCLMRTNRAHQSRAAVKGRDTFELLRVALHLNGHDAFVFDVIRLRGFELAVDETQERPLLVEHDELETHAFSMS